MLRGKSPCPRAESASGRPRGAGHDACSETIGGAAVPCRGHSHQHSYVVSAQPRAPTERGSLSCCLLTADKQHAALPTLGHKRLIRFAVADACTTMLGIACLLDCNVRLDAGNWRVLQRTGQARLRSALTGSALPSTLRGKSPCLRAASASGRPRGPGRSVTGDAFRQSCERSARAVRISTAML